MPDHRPRTVFLFPGIFGEEKTFDDLGDALRGGYDVRVVPYPTLTAPTRLLTDIDAAAASVAARLLATPSSEPDLVVGYSYGANLAFAVVAQLLAAGRRVALLALLDPALPTTDFDVHQRGPASDVVGLPLPRLGLLYRSRLLRSGLAALCRLAPPRTRQRFRRRTLWKLRGYARRAWKPRRMDCPVVHVMTAQFAPAVAQGWMDLCPDIRQVDIGARHVDLLKGAALCDVVALVAAELNRVTLRTPDELDGPRRPPPARAPRPRDRAAAPQAAGRTRSGAVDRLEHGAAPAAGPATRPRLRTAAPEV